MTTRVHHVSRLQRVQRALPSDPPSIRYPGQPALSLCAPLCPRHFHTYYFSAAPIHYLLRAALLPPPQRKWLRWRHACRGRPARCLSKVFAEWLFFFPTGRCLNPLSPPINHCFCHRRWMKGRTVNSPLYRSGEDRLHSFCFQSGENPQLSGCTRGHIPAFENVELSSDDARRKVFLLRWENCLCRG